MGPTPHPTSELLWVGSGSVLGSRAAREWDWGPSSSSFRLSEPTLPRSCAGCVPATSLTPCSEAQQPAGAGRGSLSLLQATPGNLRGPGRAWVAAAEITSQAELGTGNGRRPWPGAGAGMGTVYGRSGGWQQGWGEGPGWTGAGPQMLARRTPSLSVSGRVAGAPCRDGTPGWGGGPSDERSPLPCTERHWWGW